MRKRTPPLDMALDALASIWANACESGDAWTKQRAGRVLELNRHRLNPGRYVTAQWTMLVSVSDTPTRTQE